MLILVNIFLSLKITLPKTLQQKTLDFLQQKITMNENGDNATIQHNSQGVTGALLEHDYYDCDSEFPTLDNLQQPKHQNPSTLFDHGMYTYDPIPLPQFKTLQRIFCKQEEKLLFYSPSQKYIEI
jgi:hypothetical protein